MATNECSTSSAPQNECCCGPAAPAFIKYRPVQETGHIEASGRNVPRISTEWSFTDHLGAIAVRVGFNRMTYAVAPGLYAVGSPDNTSPVLVTANYKLTFDVVRRKLEGLNVWLLVIDTKGVNVWCAAGKGTFGTMEIARQVMLSGLEAIVTGRKLIVPQLGAPGVAAHMVQAFCGFSVQYGPIRASDIPLFLTNGMKTDLTMRRVRFSMQDRLTVAWLELALSLKAGLALSLGALAINSISSQGFTLQGAWEASSLFIMLLWGAILTGTLLTALLLPYIPFKAFSLKGGILGGLFAAGILMLHPAPLLTAISLTLFASAVSAYLAFNYTESSTFTSLSGVQKEMKYALPSIIGMLALSGVLQLMLLLRRI